MEQPYIKLYVVTFIIFPLLLLSVGCASFNNEKIVNNALDGNSFIDVKDALANLPEFSIDPLNRGKIEFLHKDVIKRRFQWCLAYGLNESEFSDPRPGIWETSEYMIGRIGVYIIFVESNGGLDPNFYDWTETSINWAKAGIYHALNWWKSQYPFSRPGLEFYVNVGTVIGYTKYEPMLRSSEDHKLWVTDVLQRLNCGEGNDHLEISKSCAHKIRQNWNMDWVFIIFVVNSGTSTPGWPDKRAFAYINGPYVVLPFGWFYHVMFEGTDGLSKIVAHEVGHIFGATDEYNGEVEYGGYLYEEDNDGSDCIMDSNKWCISNGTRRQIGWVDDNGNGYPDILENNPRIILTNKPTSVTDSENIVYEGIFMLEPYPCKRPGCRPVTINKITPLNVTGNLMAIDGSFDSAYEPFRLIYMPSKIGYQDIIFSIADYVTFKSESYNERILYTYLEAVDSEVIPQIGRVNVSTPVIIRFRVVTAHDEKPVTNGKIFINNLEGSAIGDGWFEIVTTSDIAGKFIYEPTSANVILITDVGTGILTSIKIKTKTVEIVYDRIVVEIQSLRERVDVGTEASIIVSAWYEYDKQPLIGEVILSENKVQRNVGLYKYRAIQVIDKAFRLSAFTTNEVDVIFDKVEISLFSQKQRFDVGKAPQITIDARYEYDKKPFQGEVYFNYPLMCDQVGSKTFYVIGIKDELYSLQTFDTNAIEVICDKVIVELSTKVQRVDVNSEAPINIKARYAYDSSPFLGRVHLSQDTVQSMVGLYTYSVKAIEDELYGLTVFESNEVQVIFDRVIISLTPTYDRVQVGKRAEILYKAHYSFDREPFNGEVCLDNRLISDTIGPITYSVARIVDEKYGLRTFTANSITIIFDKIMTSLNVETLMPFTTRIILKAWYEYDKKPINLGILVMDNRLIYSDERSLGLYVTEYVNLSPIITINGRFLVEGFDDIDIHENVIHIGNTMLYATACLTMVLCLRMAIKARTRAKVIVCPACGGVNYMGVRIGRIWEYECQECGRKWYVRK
ncbi:MAG: hypothetical protein QXR84_07785 [Candidatus Bathyarchaeia archaeon]